MSAPTVQSQPNWRVLQRFVNDRVTRLQNQALNNSSTARAQLAALRMEMNKPIGAHPHAWQVVFEGFPPQLQWERDEPTRAERAAHTALTLFAVHMQSAQTPMHVPDVGLGTAIRRAAGQPDADGNESPLVRRFQSLGTATTFADVQYYSRGLIQQLRAQSIGLDYAQFATDLYFLQSPTTQDNVRLRWARDLYRIRTTETVESTYQNESE